MGVVIVSASLAMSVRMTKSALAVVVLIEVPPLMVVVLAPLPERRMPSVVMAPVIVTACAMPLVFWKLRPVKLCKSAIVAVVLPVDCA
jgi:hypothetical protein